MDDLKQEVINYLLDVDRAITVDEVAEKFDLPENEINNVHNILEALLEDNYVSSDLFGDEVQVARYYPTDKLFDEFR